MPPCSKCKPPVTDEARMIDTPTIPETGQPLSSALLECVRAAASWEVVPRPASSGTFPQRVHAAQNALKTLELELETVRNSSKSEVSSNSALLELRANARLLRAAARAVSDRPRVVARLPRVLLPAQKDEPRAATIASAYLRAVGREVFGSRFPRLDPGVAGARPSNAR